MMTRSVIAQWKLQTRKNLARGVLAGLVLVMLAGCGGLPGIGGAAPTRYPFPTTTPAARLPVTFIVSVPDETDSESTVVLNLLEEVTGLALNSNVIAMESLGGGKWQARADLPRGRVVFYRYSLRGEGETLEGLPGGEAVDYRLFQVTGANTVDDQISRWLTTTYSRPSGQVHGLVRDQATGLAIPGLMVSVAGMRTWTDTAGAYKFDSVPAGKHMIIYFDPDGNYRTFQQEGIVADGAETPADVQLQPAPRVSVTLHVYLPADTPAGAPVRLVGNLLSLGSTFQPAAAGSLIEPSRALTLTPLPDGTSVAVVSLPVGFHLRYKFTLGDGFWNAERDGANALVVRELDVPQMDALQTDGVITWHSAGGAVSYEASVPAGTPATENVSIQFAPFPGIWMNPIPMWSAGAQRWNYTLFSPLEWSGPVGYRYCRNGDCGVADDAATAGANPAGRQFTPSAQPQTLSDTVQAWVAWGEAPPPSLTLATPAARPDFRTGVVLTSAPWRRPFDPTLVDVLGLSANTLVFSPAWYAAAVTPLPDLVYLPGQSSPLRQDLLAQIGSARSAGLRIVLAPDLLPLSGSLGDWWAASPKSVEWWNAWFTAYRTFLVGFADLAQQAGVEELVVARTSVGPAMPGAAGAPADSEIRWRVLIRDLRNHFGGRIAVELLLTDQLQMAPLFLDEVDTIYVQVRSPLGANDGASMEEMSAATGALLDGKVAVLRALGKPIVVEADFASASGGASGCPNDTSGTCLALEALTSGSPLALAVAPNLSLQANAYQALLAGAAARDWVSGFVAWGYYPPVGLRDASPSVHGKPAETVLQVFFRGLSGR